MLRHLRVSYLKRINKITSVPISSVKVKSIVTVHSATSRFRKMASLPTNGHPTAGIIVIGDEVLKGQTKDTNSHFICQRLFSLGVKVDKISVIGDDIDVISNEVNKFSHHYTYVITTGGVGPTHDDKTHLGVARAFNDEIAPHPEFVGLCKKIFKTDDLTSAQLKLCSIAKTAVLEKLSDPNTGKSERFPLVKVNNVFIFPGVPKIMERAFVAAEHLFKSSCVKFYTQELYVNVDELKIASILEDVQKDHENRVLIGSYPNFTNSYYKVKLTLQSEVNDHLMAATSQLTTLLPNGSVIDYDKDPLSNSTTHVYNFLKVTAISEDDKIYHDNIRTAITVLEEALSKYSLNELCICFNGGKDCTVLLHLLYAVIKHVHPDYNNQLNALYIRCQSPFPEVEEFIRISEDRYDMNLIQLDGRIKESLASFQAMKPEITAIVMGTRRSDPKSDSLNAFTPTDSDWPTYMRINPLLTWRYQDVWRFLRALSLPYCNLYDGGYTSLGSMSNTRPNPTLQYTNEYGTISYLPAYRLIQDDTERDGRSHVDDIILHQL